MPFHCAINRINHVERAPRRAAMFDIPGTDIKRKKFGGQAALLHPLEAGAIGKRRRANEIVIVVRHRRGYVVMRIDDDRAAMNCERLLPEFFVTRSRRRRWYIPLTI